MMRGNTLLPLDELIAKMMLTLARYLDPGRPPSRAKAHSMREAVATRPTVAKNWVTMMTQA